MWIVKVYGELISRVCHDAHVEIFPIPISRTAQGFSFIAKFVQELPVDVFTDDWVMFFDGLLAPLQKCVNGLFTFQDDEVGKLPLKGGIALSTEHCQTFRSQALLAGSFCTQSL